MTSTPALERLDAIDARAQAATPGPWTVSPSRRGGVIAPREPGDMGGGLGLVAEAYGLRPRHREDAVFIADARTTVPALTAALRAVLNLHIEQSASHDQSGWTYCYTCETTYPCPTVRTVESALAVTE